MVHRKIAVITGPKALIGLSIGIVVGIPGTACGENLGGTQSTAPSAVMFDPFSSA